MKLYKCEYTLTYYAVAETPEDAQDLLSEAIETEHHHASNTAVLQIKDPNHRIEDGWDRNSLVYGADNELTLGQALKECNKP